MKNTLSKAIIAGLLVIAGSANSQITLENSYPSPSSGASIGYADLTNNGEKYYIVNSNLPQIKLYDMSHALWKTITLPKTSSQVFLGIYNVSDNLFATDNAVEVLYANYSYNYTVTPNVVNYDMRIINESGTVLKTFNSNYATIVKAHAGFKLLVAADSVNKGGRREALQVYSLPGTMPITSVRENPGTDPAGMLSAPVPNPSNGKTVIAYNLPPGAEADIVIYDVAGKELKRYTVDGNFSTLELDNTDLAPGTYMYNMGGSAGRKMIIVK